MRANVSVSGFLQTAVSNAPVRSSEAICMSVGASDTALAFVDNLIFHRYGGVVCLPLISAETPSLTFEGEKA